MRISAAIFAVFSVCVLGYYAHVPRPAVIPGDLRDAVADTPLNALKSEAGAEEAALKLPEAKAEYVDVNKLTAPQQNDLLRRKMDFPVFFFLPKSAMLPNTYGLIEYRPPDSVLKPKNLPKALDESRNAQAKLGEVRMPDPGLFKADRAAQPPADNADPYIYSIHPANPPTFHVALVSRKEAAKKLAQMGVVQTGDVILTVRPEWAFRGAYPNMMMGISHAGFAFVDKGLAYNLDHPLGSDYCGNFDSDHYIHARVFHVIRPRKITAKQKENLDSLAKILYKTQPMSGHDLVPGEINFNDDYTKPTYSFDQRFPVVVGKVALGIKDEGVKIFCSEFVWSLLALKGCDLKTEAAAFKIPGNVPACMKEPFKPLPVLGEAALNPGAPGTPLGFFDGPLTIINSMGLPEAEKAVLIHTMFTKLRPKDTDSESLYSEGPTFDKLEDYFAGVSAKAPAAAALKGAYNSGFEKNYPPVAYLINALLPENSPDRVMDVVGTVVFSD